jgi:hypothetical protein
VNRAPDPVSQGSHRHGPREEVDGREVHPLRRGLCQEVEHVLPQDADALSRQVGRMLIVIVCFLILYVAILKESSLVVIQRHRIYFCRPTTNFRHNIIIA